MQNCAEHSKQSGIGMDYELIEAKSTAKCPRCGRRVTLEAGFTATVRGACLHYSHAERVEGLLFIAFSKPNTKPPQDHS